MSDVTRILDAIGQGDPRAAGELLPLVYEELRRLALRKMVRESPGQTLDATGLVHEAYLRLVKGAEDRPWENRGHFFAAAAEAMRRILVDKARKKASIKHGGRLDRVETDPDKFPAPEPDDELIALDEALTKLADRDAAKAELVKLRHFSGLTIEQASKVLGISTATAERWWAFSKAWLRREISDVQRPS